MNLLTEEALASYRLIKIRVITMSDEMADTLDYESKLYRHPQFIHNLIAHGR